MQIRMDWRSVSFDWNQVRAFLAETRDALFVGVDQSSAMIDFLSAHGLHLAPGNFRFYCENTVVGWEMVKQGLAIGVMSEAIAGRSDGVVRILPDFTPIPVPVWLVTHRELHTSARIRLVYDLLAEALR